MTWKMSLLWFTLFSVSCFDALKSAEEEEEEEEDSNARREGTQQGECKDGIDNDDDGWIDCDDQDCQSKPVCAGSEDTAEDPDVDTDMDTDTDTDADIAAGQQLIEESCTSSCHSGQDMGERSSRYPDDAELASVIRGEAGGPMGGVGWVSDSWSDTDMTNAIAYLRSIE